MAQQNFNQFGTGSGGGGGAIDPNDLAMSGNYPSSSFSNFNSGSNNPSNAYSSGGGLFADDELLDGLSSPTDPPMRGPGGDYNGLDNMGMGFGQSMYSHQDGSGIGIGQHINGYSNTPDGNPIQSPFVHSFNENQFRSMHHAIQSPMAGYPGSPLTPSGDINTDDASFAKSRARVSQQMQRKASSTRSPMTPGTKAIHSIPMGSLDSTGFGSQPIRTTGLHEKSPSGQQWAHTPTGSMAASYGSGFSSPVQPGLMQINEVMVKGGTSMPTKLGAASGPVSTQEMKRKRRRESHNLVERRRRDNINERIQDLSRLVPSHRLEDEKIRKLIQNGTPLSPTLTGIASPGQATSGLAGPGARRAAGGSAGNITTGLPIEEKDKGPNKGDILNGAVSWTRDLMWMLHLKLQQQEELMNTISDLGGHFPFELTEDEKRMQTELMDAMTKNEGVSFSYSRAPGSGLRVPHHTDYRGDSVHGSGNGAAFDMGLGMGADTMDSNQYLFDPDDDGSGRNSINFKEEDEYDMDLTH